MQNTPCLSAHATTSHANSRTKGQSGFTLMELMVAVIVVGILAAVAIPSYTSYINKSRAKSASADLAALALNMENRYQLQLTYPVYAANTAATNTIFSAWSPTQASYFNYTMVSTASSYTLTATGKGSSAGCTISLDNLNTRTASSSCGFTSW
ncbi:type IV pilin protein [Roseateles albus]|uniref:Type IV pilin protein n=1 Tax=Roseateles albus TaxID=2987525 RepID=A0ABT5KJU5_9BURK|nr:type IV pilin protein [Roseateles albus]MDC8773101.1 type IV pilin protein [Roseateles albus]